MAKLGVNIDHVATLRQQRGAKFPDPSLAAQICENAGADSITVHLREDRRHIQDRDVKLLRATIQTRLNLEMAATSEMIQIAKQIKPDSVCLVPERRQELTTEGGLDVIKHASVVRGAVHDLMAAGIEVSLFIDPDPKQIEMARELSAPVIELHTGTYCDARGKKKTEELYRILSATEVAKSLHLKCNAGHGLDYWNIKPLAKHNAIYEFNIGHSIISRAVLVGLDQAVRDMVALL